MTSLTSYFNKEQLGTIQLAGRVSSVLALIGAVSIIVSYIFYPSFRRYGTRPILFMCVSSMLAASSTVMGRYYLDNNLQTACQIQAFNFQTFYVASSMWSSAIATSLILVVRFRIPPPHLFKYEKYYHAVCWGLPLLITLVLLLGNHGKGPVFGDATFWCWMVDEYASLRIFFFFGVMWVCFVYNSICYGTVGFILWQSQRKLKQASGYESGSASGGESSGSHNYSDWKTAKLNEAATANISRAQDKTMRRFTKRTSAYILAFMIIWTPGTVNRLQNIADPVHPIYALFVIHALCLPIGGFMEAVIWFGPSIYKFIQTRILKKPAKSNNSSSNHSEPRQQSTLSKGSAHSNNTYKLQTFDAEYQRSRSPGLDDTWNQSMSNQTDIDEMSRGGLSWVDSSRQNKSWYPAKPRPLSGSADPLWNNADNRQYNPDLDTSWGSSEATWTSPAPISPPKKQFGALVQNSLSNIPVPPSNSNLQFPDQFAVLGRATGPGGMNTPKRR